MHARGSEGKAAAGLVALLAILVAVGGGNYVRNLKAEAAAETGRPFLRYEREDLESLRAAYQAEVEQMQARYERARSRRKQAGGAVMMDQAVADFERIRQQSDGLRELSTEIAGREARIREIDQELAARNALGAGWEAHLRRLTSF